MCCALTIWCILQVCASYKDFGEAPLPPVPRDEDGKITCLAVVDPAPVQAPDEAKFMALQE
jgi:hypothetical protein